MSHCSPTSSTTCVTSGRRTSWRRPDSGERRWTIDSNWNCHFYSFLLWKSGSGFSEIVFVIGNRHMYSTERFILFADTICFDMSAKAALHIIAGQLNEERDRCNSKLPESSLSWYKDLFLQDQIKQLRDVFMMIDGNGDGPLLRAVDCEICRICLVLCVHRFAEVFGTVSARLIWHLCKRHRCRQNRDKSANPWPNFIRSSQFILFTLAPSVHSKRCNFDIWRPGVDRIGLISKLVFVYQCLWPCMVRESIVTNTSTQSFQASHTHLQKALDTSQAQLIGRSSTPLDRRLVDASTLDMVWEVWRSLSQNQIESGCNEWLSLIPCRCWPYPQALDHADDGAVEWLWGFLTVNELKEGLAKCHTQGMAKKIEFPTSCNFESVQNQAVLNSFQGSRLNSHTYLFGCWLLQDCVYLQSTSWQWPCKILWALGMTPGLLFGKGLGGTHQVQLCHWGLASKIFLKICCRSWRTVRLDLGMSTQLQGQPNLKTVDVSKT